MEIEIISGKGGTGKSSISAAFTTYLSKVVLADCDVDAANMYVLFEHTIEFEDVYYGSKKAVVDYNYCSSCGICIDYCRFDAISLKDEKIFISDYSCEGCQLCARVCPNGAIKMVNIGDSRIYGGSFRNGKIVYGKLAPGEENSGKLVNLVRNNAKSIAEKEKIDIIIIDGPPGIGCPVLSTITGVDHVIIVVEPTLSALSDFQRVINITSKYNLHSWVIINKSDLNVDVTNNIKSFCHTNNIDVLCELPFDENVVFAMVNRKTIPEFIPDSQINKLLKNAFYKILNNEDKQII